MKTATIDQISLKYFVLNYRKERRKEGKERKRKGGKSTISRNEEGAIFCIYTEYRKEAYNKKKLSNTIIKQIFKSGWYKN